ncbi:MAG: hypothetical protein WAW85_08215 [Gordonia sp. (in: high G+C Gram-positive bacteria)]|uniref:hypothetical protein n=1 Tax=Gordonia sp. (in: high G+C Gram-positive bacteria) TaxID=84139 RepID=UPI003BB51350
MNHDPHEHRTDRTLEPAFRTTEAVEADVSALAVHRDPSQSPAARRGQEPAKEQKTIAWVRPSELVTALGSDRLRGGIDLEAELARRARRTPAQAAWKVRRRITRNAIGRPDASASASAPSVTDQGIRL